MAVIRIDESKWPSLSWVGKREAIADAIDEIRNEFIYYARKHDERLPVGAIEEALKGRRDFSQGNWRVVR